MANNIVFSDIDFMFTRHPVSDDVTRKTDVAAVKQSIRNLLLTGHYERPFNSALGSSLNDLLFEPFSPMLKIMMKGMIEQLITNYEPRVALEDIQLSFDEGNNSIDISISFYITNTTTLQQFTLILERTR